MAAPLSAEQIQEVRQFFESPTADLLFQHLETGLISDWINGQEVVDREECWCGLQAVLRLKFMLRDAAAMKRLTERAQERRIYATRTEGV